MVVLGALVSESGMERAGRVECVVVERSLAVRAPRRGGVLALVAGSKRAVKVVRVLGVVDVEEDEERWKARGCGVEKVRVPSLPLKMPRLTVLERVRRYVELSCVIRRGGNSGVAGVTWILRREETSVEGKPEEVEDNGVVESSFAWTA